MLMFAKPMSRARPNAWVACAASVRRSSTARARRSNPCTPRLSRFTPPSSHAATLGSSELAAQMLDRLLVVGHELFDPLSDAVLGASDLPTDLLHVRILRAVPLALAPQARVLVAQVGDRPPHLAVQAPTVPRLRALDLLS